MSQYNQHSDTKPTYVEGIPVEPVTPACSGGYHHNNQEYRDHGSQCGSYCSTTATSTRSSPHMVRSPHHKQYVSVSGHRRPVQLTVCPSCEAKNVRTRTRTHPSGGTWIAVGVTAIIFWPVCWIPLVMDSMRQTDHYCQCCGQKIAKVKPMEGFGVKERR